MKHTPLKPGATIGVMAPSSWVEKGDIEQSKALLEQRGYKVFIHPQTYERENQSAGDVLQKSLALQGLWQRNDIDAIWAAGGGNRALYLLDAINFEKMKDNPKPLIGFSDITALLTALYAHTGQISYHGPVFKDLHRQPAQLDQALKTLTGKTKAYDFKGAKTLNPGKTQGHLIGGNLSLFQYLPQTLPGDFCKGALLFLEDCNEELSRIDRMILHLKRLGVFKEINGLIFGEFSGMKESGKPFGYTLEDIIRQNTEDLDIPIIINAPFGHEDNLPTFPIGQTAKIQANDTISLKLMALVN